MGFYVIERLVFSFAEGVKGAYLIDNAGVGLVGREVHVASAKTLQVGIARVGTNGDFGIAGQLHSLAHDRRVACVHAAGHVAARDKRNDFGVEPKGVASEAFSEVAVKVYAQHGFSFRIGYCRYSRYRRCAGVVATVGPVGIVGAQALYLL